MRKALFVLLLVLLPASSLLAQPWRNRRYEPYRDNQIDLTPFIGYRYGGTSEIDSTARIDASVGCQLLDQIGCQHGEIEAFAILDSTSRLDATHRDDRDPLPGLLLVSISQLSQYLTHRHRGDAGDDVKLA